MFLSSFRSVDLHISRVERFKSRGPSEPFIEATHAQKIVHEDSSSSSASFLTRFDLLRRSPCFLWCLLLLPVLGPSEYRSSSRMESSAMILSEVVRLFALSCGWPTGRDYDSYAGTLIISGASLLWAELTEMDADFLWWVPATRESSEVQRRDCSLDSSIAQIFLKTFSIYSLL